MHKVIVIFGTRPEAIKLGPVVEQLRAHPDLLRPVVCSTAQHRELLDLSLASFDLVPDYDLAIMEPDQSLFTVTVKALGAIEGVLASERPSLVMVQGDTTTAFAAGLAAYYFQIPVAHVEAGLRTGNRYSPFPEEANRRMLSVVTDYHFAPTERAQKALLREGIAADRVWVTGNTVVDALLKIRSLQEAQKCRDELRDYFRSRHGLDLAAGAGEDRNPSEKDIVVVTAHRRENFNAGLRNICQALRDIAAARKDVLVVFPVHPNPNVRGPVADLLGGVDNIILTDPMEYYHFLFLLSRARLILTDSGGIQEEAPSLQVPVLVMRENTERPEGITAGTARLVGTDREAIREAAVEILSDESAWRAMIRKTNPYGDGRAARRIVDVVIENCGRNRP